MTQNSARKEKPFLYWITLGIIFASFITLASLSGCAVHDKSPKPSAEMLASDIHTNPAACSSRLVGKHRSTEGVLDSEDIRLVNWNIQKGGDSTWSTDLATMQSGPGLVVLQEVPLNSSAWVPSTADRHHAFSPGYRTRKSLTGVMTISATKPLTQCNFMSVEPWLRSAKATVITEYGLSNTDQTLLVANIHALNFTFGIHDFREQIRLVQSVMNHHAGPILLSGDFNTWHWRRSEIVNEMTTSLGLEMLGYDEDHRKRFLGQPLDHIYIRGLEIVQATTREVDSSDHNPMSAQFRL